MAPPPNGTPETPTATLTAMALTVKEATKVEVEGAGDALIELSHLIWDTPELAFEEEVASDACARGAR